MEVVARLLRDCWDCCGGGRRNGGSGGINPAKACAVGGMDETRVVDENVGRMMLR